ncbi:MAG TPA: alanine--glyoxylate aminotransferase family protein [Actinomycetota bacterium]|jgi:aspartate aminotransferase-like enzyme|nr:alanine--glyoxylate aminotransferase family protein [Actinomycetota bacterium]
MSIERPEFLAAPGPTEVPPDVLQAQAREVPYHRGPRFGAILQGCVDSLRRILFTSNDVLFYTSSGSLGMESAIVNVLSPGDRILILNTGNFADRFEEIARIHGVESTVVTYEWGANAKAEDVSKALADDPSIKAVYVQHSETSTGIVNDVEAIGRVLKDKPQLYVVDGISAVGAAPLRVDDWGIDVLVGGSQKALMTPPGIAFVTVSKAAWDAAATAACPRFYTDWATAAKSLSLDPPETPYTPAVTIFAAFRKALSLVEGEGIEAAWARHALLGKACREGVKALGLDIQTEEADRACVLTAVVAPEGLDGAQIAKHLRERHGIVVAPGQGKLKGKIFRIGHCGYYSPRDILMVLAAVESTLAGLGHPIKEGAGTGAAAAVFREAERA